MANFGTFATATAWAAALSSGAVAEAQPATPDAHASSEASPSAEQLAIARRLVAQVSGPQLHTFAVGIFQRIEQELNIQVTTRLGSTDPALSQRISSAVTTMRDQTEKRLIDAAALGYARTMSREEMEDAVAFYSRPAGQALLRSNPSVSHEVNQALTETISNMRLGVIEAACANGGCTPDQKDAMLHPSPPPPPLVVPPPPPPRR